MATVYGYARCSTSDGRQDVERQLAELGAKGATALFEEYGSGARDDRPQFAKMMSLISDGDTLMATEASRLTRSLHSLCHLCETAMAKRLRLVLGGLVVDFADGSAEPFALAMLQIVGVFAELERNMASQRIRSGISHARGKGVALGRPRKTAADVPLAVREVLSRFPVGSKSKTELARLAGVSRSSLNKYARLLEVPCSS